MIFSTLESSADTTAARCLDLIARCAPGMMRAGGGALGVESLQSGRKLSWGQRRRIVRLRRCGMAPKDIAAEVGVSAPTVTRICQAAGIKRARVAVRFSAAQVAEMVELRREGRTLREIAARFGCSISGVDKRVRGSHV